MAAPLPETYLITHSPYMMANCSSGSPGGSPMACAVPTVVLAQEATFDNTLCQLFHEQRYTVTSGKDLAHYLFGQLLAPGDLLSN